MKQIVYSISCPINKIVVYVGRTNRVFEQRMYEHYRKSTNPLLFSFMDNLKAKGLFPVCKILDSSNGKGEEYWINYYKKINPDLFNRICGKPKSDNGFRLISDFSQTYNITV